MNIPLIGKKKRFKIETLIFQRIGRVILWTLIILLFLRAAVSLLRPSDIHAANNLINQYTAAEAYKSRVELEAKAFAERFAEEYFTHKGVMGDYEQRLSKFLPSYITITGPGFSQGNVKTEVLRSSSYSIEWFSSNQVNVAVALKVRYTTETRDEEEVKRDSQESDVYLLVPVMEKEGKYVVEDLPAIIPAPPKADISASHYQGAALDSNTTREIRDVLENFFKTYYSGNPGEISYYMLENKAIRGIEKRYTLQRIEGVRAFTEGKENEIFTLVELSIQDEISKFTLKQNYQVTLVQRDGRYYIKDFDIRTVNLNREMKEEI